MNYFKFVLISLGIIWLGCYFDKAVNYDPSTLYNFIFYTGCFIVSLGLSLKND